MPASGAGADADAISTPRLKLRRWLPGDREEFAAINNHPEVMRYLLRPLSRSESDRMMERIEAHFERHGYGLWAVEVAASSRLAGFVGFQWTEFEADFTPCVEIGWRLGREFWGNGYATEAARACLSYGFDALAFEAVFSFTSVVNVRSIAVMRRIGLRHLRNFPHPMIAPGHELSEHVLYALKRDEGPAGPPA